MRLVAALLVLLMSGAGAFADSTADCGRFFLKYNPDTKRMECVGAKRDLSKRSRNVTTIARDIQRSIGALQRVVSQAETLLSRDYGDEISQEAQRRVSTLLTEARQRTREIQRKSRELQQAQLQRTQ